MCNTQALCCCCEYVLAFPTSSHMYYSIFLQLPFLWRKHEQKIENSEVVACYNAQIIIGFLFHISNKCVLRIIKEF